MFDLVQCTPTSRDCTCGYNVKLDKEYLVSEFIETILKERSNEWGFISINKNKSYFNNPQCEYRQGNILSETLPKEYLTKKVNSVIASDGWSRMDYIITC